ncbi:MAG: O-antigen ligase family protein [Pseudomonadota bacterium]
MLLAGAWLTAERYGSLREWLIVLGVVTATGLLAATIGYLGHEQVYWVFVRDWLVLFVIYWAATGLAAAYEPRQLRLLLGIIVGLGHFQAVYGLIAVASADPLILGVWPRLISLDVLTGTFINRNHVVDLLAAAWIFGLALTPELLRERPLRWGGWFLLSLVLGMAVFATQSRLGVAAAVAGIALFGFLRHRSMQAGAELSMRWVAGALGVGLVAAVWFGLAGLVGRFLQVPDDVGRLELWRGVLEAPAALWWLGAGPGQFADAFKAFKPLALVADTEHAHNDYLEILFELGIVGATVCLGALLWWLHRRWGLPPHPLRGAAVAVVAVYLVHALGDFGLHVPGAAIVFWIALGIAVNDRLEPPPSGRRRRSSGR